MHWPVASQCIAHGVKDQLSEAGADTSQFKVHSHHRWLWTKGLLRGISCRWSTGVLTPHLGFITILLMIILPILAGKFCKWSSWVRKCSTHHWSHLPACSPFCIGLFNSTQCHIQRISQNISTNLVRVQGARGQVRWAPFMLSCSSLSHRWTCKKIFHGEVVKAAL